MSDLLLKPHLPGDSPGIPNPRNRPPWSNSHHPSLLRGLLCASIQDLLSSPLPELINLDVCVQMLRPLILRSVGTEEEREVWRDYANQSYSLSKPVLLSL